MPRGRKRTEDGADLHTRPAFKRNRLTDHAAPTLFSQAYRNRPPCFSEKQCLEWFREYTTADEPDLLGPEGMERFCEDIGVEPENVVMLVIAWSMDAANMGFFTSAEWVRGLTYFQSDCAEKLRARLEHMRALLDNPDTFKAIYRYSFDFARDGNQRSLSLDVGRPLLQLLLGRHWPIYAAFHRFLERAKCAAINRDQWNNILEFSRSIQPDMANYDENGAWPVLLDEFVEWYRTEYRLPRTPHPPSDSAMEAD